MLFINIDNSTFLDANRNSPFTKANTFKLKWVDHTKFYGVNGGLADATTIKL